MLTPEWLDFSITTPLPIQMRQGASSYILPRHWIGEHGGCRGQRFVFGFLIGQHEFHCETCLAQPGANAFHQIHHVLRLAIK